MIAGGATISLPICFSSRGPSKTWNSKPYNYFPGKFADQHMFSYKSQACSLFFTFPPAKIQPHFSVKASASVGSAEYTEEPATSVKFQKSLSLPVCSSSLSLLGTGYREKVFAIIGVKVYAAGLYVNQSILSKLDTWKGQTAAKIQEDSSLFDTIYRIVLVRDVDGKTFWDALDDAVSPRIKARTPVDECALSTFRSIFQGRSLKKGTFIFLTWINPSKMLVSVFSWT